MTPTVPQRHPARTSRSHTNQSSRKASLADEYLELWEQAALLYHGFEWQSAAETFLLLSRQIGAKLESMLCLLNAAIVFSRLGDFATAAQILEEAEPEGDMLPLTMFILGHVEFEQGNFEKSEDSFRIALQFLNGPTQRYEHYGLNFTLRTSHIQQLLRIFQSKNNLFGILGTIGALPADGIFESPTRADEDTAISPITSRASSDSGGVPPLSEVSSPSSVAASPIEARSDDRSRDLWLQPPQQDHGDAILNLFDVKEDANTYTLKTKPRVQSVRKSSQPKGVESFVKTLSQKQIPTIASPRRPKHEARDARIRGESVSSLSTFIRQLPAQNAMEPKKAVGEGNVANHLAKFLRAYPPKQPSPCGSIYSPHDLSGSSKAASISSAESVTEESLTQKAYASKETPALRRPYFGSLRTRASQRSAVSAAHGSPHPQDHVAFWAANMNMGDDSLHDVTYDPRGSRATARSFAYTDEMTCASQRSSVYSQRTASPALRAVSIKRSVGAIHPALRHDTPRRSSSVFGAQAPERTNYDGRLERPIAVTSQSTPVASKPHTVISVAKPASIVSARFLRSPSKKEIRKETRKEPPKETRKEAQKEPAKDVMGYASYFGRWGEKMKS